MPKSVVRALAPLLLAFAASAWADDLPYPKGSSEHKLEGLDTSLLVPEISRGEKCSMIVLLHGSGDSGQNLIRGMTRWEQAGYLVCAPTATVRRAWSTNDLKLVKKIADHLKKVMPIDAKKVHVVGFSNGGWNLTPLAFDDDLRPCSATYIAAGYRGGKVPKWAKKGLGVLALAGEQDGNVGAARGTVTQLRGKVASVEVRTQANLGHKWPREHDAYQLWWMGAREGRFKPGDDKNFRWSEDLEQAIESQKSKKRGGVLVYVYNDSPEAKKLQNETFMDPAVRFYGGQLAAVMMELDEEAQALGVKAAPAVVVLKKDGTVKKLLTGKIKARSLASALRGVAPTRRMPK